MKKPCAVVLLLVTSLLAAACAGGGKGGGAGGATTTVPSNTGPVGTDPALVAKAKAAVLQQADFPDGFPAQEEEPGQGLSIETVWQELTRCLGVEATATPAGRATSPTFLRRIATQGRSTVEYTTESSASALAPALTGPKSPTCFKEVFSTDLDRSKPEGAKPGPVAVATRDYPPIGKKVLAWRITGSVNLAELVVPIVQDFLVIVDGGTVVRMFFLSTGSEFPQDLERTLVQKVVGRA